MDSIGFTYNLNNRTLIKGADSLESPKREFWASYSPDSTWIAFAKNHNLYLMKAGDSDSVEYQLTDDGEKYYSYGASDSDTTTTKRVRARAMWFKDSKKLYVKRTDSRKVGDLWVINSYGKDRPTLETYKYPMPGEKDIQQEELFIFDVADKSKVKVNVEKWKDQSLGGAYFGSGGGFFMPMKTSDYLYFIRRDRTWSRLSSARLTPKQWLQYSSRKKASLYFNTRYAQVGLINEGKEIIWWSERTGWGQLYLYDANGKLKNKITDGYFVVGDIQKIDTLKRVIYYDAFGKEKGIDPYYSIHYKVGFDGSGQKLLTPEDATHSANFSDKSNFFVDNYSRVDMIPEAVLRDSEGRVVMKLETADVSRLMEAGYQMPEKFTVKAADGATDLYGVMWKPFDFDSTKKYPVITYVYPGPQTEPVPLNFVGARGRNVPLSQLGFIVVAVGQRGGSPQRSSTTILMAMTT